MKLRKISALILSLSLSATMLAGCGGAPASSAAPVESSSAPAESSSAASSAAPAESAATTLSGTIKVSAWDMASAPYFQQTADEFMKLNPDVKVEMIDIPSADYTQKLSVMLNGGSDVDAMWIKDADTTKSLYTKGQLLDLTQRVADDKVDLAAYNGLDKNFTFDGKISGLPARSDWYVLYYNKDLFDAAGIEYPSNDMTWAQYEELAKKLTSGEGATKNYGALIHTWQACVENWGIADGKNNILATDYSFWTEHYQRALRMQNDDKSVMDYATMKTGNIHYSSPFLTGNVAMMPMGTWFMGTIIAKKAAGESKVNWGVATIPHNEGAPAGQTVGSATPIAINNASKNQDAAWAFVKFLTGPEGANVVAKTGTMPGYTDEALLKVATSLDGMSEGVTEALKVSSIALDRPVDEKSAEVNTMLGEEHGLIMLGEKTVEQGLADMAKRSKEIQGK